MGSVPQVRDRRVERTQEQLRQALVSLIRERGFESLTVQDIIDRANVGRATFYAHFDNKDDLLASGFDRLRDSLRTLQREAMERRGPIDRRVFAFTHEVFAHTDAHRDLVRLMIGKRSGAAVQRILHKLLLDLVRRDVEACCRRLRSDDTREALVQFLTGALFGLLMWWVEGKRRPLPVEDVNDLFRRMAIPALQATAHRVD
jgi:AcrR family transcriptional regulator